MLTAFQGLLESCENGEITGCRKPLHLPEGAQAYCKFTIDF